MAYSLQRYEKYIDKSGKVIGVFVAVSVVDTNNNSLIQDYFLNSDEVATVAADETKLTPILERVAAIGEKMLENLVANKPPPPIVADEAKKSKFSIDPKNVAKEKRKLN